MWECICDCGEKVIIESIKLGKNGPKSCGCSRRKDGQVLNSQGYVRVYAAGRYVLEHRVIVAGLIGRPLFPDEIVHHRDGNRRNNDPKNLELCVKQPLCQRVSDIISWAIEVLKRYAPEKLNGD